MYCSMVRRIAIILFFLYVEFRSEQTYEIKFWNYVRKWIFINFNFQIIHPYIIILLKI